ncbi:MAG TPA: sensor histidine kinase KdpD [Anaerolineae bacterium]|nr:sensor histidine kinase KdpD [Anaerolineae bacterium]
MSDQRPDPDELLARVKHEESKRLRGRLKIFFGATAGVGKTYAMLEQARAMKAKGVDVLAGVVETHGRAETEAMLQGLDILPPRLVDYRGTQLQEFDLDAALHRHPALILLDELAHTNATGSRHAKRWQDVDDLLTVGINVYTTMNVQHMESLNDVVAQITNVVVRETVPDSIVEQADEVELIDLPPDELIQRLREGKVYVSQQAEQAIENFFRKGNLIALRELALRRTADRVDAQMQMYRRDHSIATTWPTNERLLVCIGPNPLATRLVRAARRMAAGLHAEWLVVYVETPGHLRLPEADRNRVIDTLRLAERLGAETITLSGQTVSEEIINYARRRNISKIVVGKPHRSPWRQWLRGSIVDAIIRSSGEIDVYVITGDRGEPRSIQRAIGLRRTSSWSAYAWGMVIVLGCTGLAGLLQPLLDPLNLVMIYLLGVVLTAVRYGRGPSILATILSVAAFDFFFVPPFLTFAVSDTQYIITFGVMLVTALIISNLTWRTRQQAEAARHRERRTAALYAMGRELVSMRGIQNLASAALRHVNEVFNCQVIILLPDANGEMTSPVLPTNFAIDVKEQSVAQWVFDRSQMAGKDTDTLPSATALYLPMIASRGTIGVLGVRTIDKLNLSEPEQLHTLEAFASQAALAIERARLSDEAEQAKIQVETERLRNSLLSSVSHDLRTPLASISGAASSLLEADLLDAETRRDLAEAIYEEASRLDRLVRNLLDMTRLESGAIKLQKEWQPLEEVIGVVLARLADQLKDRSVSTHLPIDLPLVPLDGVLIEQVLLNLLENAIKYTPAGSPIDLSAWADHDQVTIEIADRGPGLPVGEEQRIFEKFYRAQKPETHGVGLGLTICRGIVEAHGGRIWAENRSGGGTTFRFTLPLEGTPPKIDSNIKSIAAESS